jgi:phage tail sheath protein FI
MPTYLHPGVYIEEVPGGARPIEAVGTSTAAFVGIAVKGPLDEARFITNFSEYQETYGGYVSDNFVGKSYLAYSVFHFFQNGGTACYVVRVEDGARSAEVDLYTAEGLRTMTVKAVSPGSWGNDLRVAIGGATTSETGFNMYVLKGDEIVETYEDLSMVDDNIFYVDRVTRRSLNIRTESTSLPDNPTLTGKELAAGANLQNVKNIKLQIDSYGPYDIDCAAGATTAAAVTANEIRANINKAFENDIKVAVASVSGDDEVVITSPTADDDSRIIFTAPGNQDATFDIFGLQESSWKVAPAAQETAALAYGFAAPPDTTTNPAGPSITCALGAGGDTLIPITNSATPFTVVGEINTAMGSDIAFTDGQRLVLMAAEDIHLRRSTPAMRDGITALFGAGFYSYVSVGSGNDPAVVTGNIDIPGAGVNGLLRLTVDTDPTFDAAFSGESTAEAVAKTINDAYQKVSKSKKKIARPNGDRINLSSINTGDNGRIIVSSHTGTDAVGQVLNTGHQNADGTFTIPAVEQWVARLNGTVDLALAPGQIGPALAGATLRMAAGGTPVQFSLASAVTASAEDMFTNDFAAQTDLNHKLLAQVTAAGEINVYLVAASLAEKPELHFSIPLAAGEISAHIPDAAAASHAAYQRLFGAQAPFVGAAHVVPNYTYRFLAPNNNPKETLLVSGEEIDFSASKALTGGDQDRTAENRISNLTVGSMPGVTSGIRLLDTLTDISILVIPGWSRMGDPVANNLLNAGIAYCDKVRPAQARPLRDLFLVTNPPASVIQPTDARNYVRNTITTSSAGGYVGLYFPWISVTDPIGTKSPTLSIPPAGTIAGLYASIDGRRGVWKAPAGTEAGLAGVTGLAAEINDVKQDILNPHGVDVIRRVPGAGIVSWGARTLATNPEWKYVPVRRTAIMIEVSVYEGIQWAVFEPNDEPLWSSLRLNIGAFMMNLFRNGAFQGATPDAAFFVKCDSETTTQNDIDLGKVNIHIGFAPLKPAEFVIVKISQKAGQSE